MKRFALMFPVVLAFVLLTGRPAAAYWDDVHYHLTYYVARMSGYTPEQAYRVAAADLSTDYHAATEPTQTSKTEALSGRYADPQPANRQNPRWMFHAFRNEIGPRDVVGNGALGGAAAGEVVAQQGTLFGAGVKSKNPGVFFHFFQDIVPHTGFGSNWGHWYNPQKPTESTVQARGAGLPIGGAVDWLSFFPKQSARDLGDGTSAWLRTFLDRASPAQARARAGSRQYGAVVDELWRINEAPAPLTLEELPLYNDYKASKIELDKLGMNLMHPPPKLSAEREKKFDKHHLGPSLDGAAAVIEKALRDQDAAENNTGFKTYKQGQNEFAFDANGNVTSDPNKFVLVGSLKVNVRADGQASPGQTAKIAVILPSTMRGEADAKLVEADVPFNDSITFDGDRILPVGDLIVEGSAGEAPVRQNVKLEGATAEVTITIVPPKKKPEPPKPVEKKITLLSASAAPAEAKIGERVVLTFEYEVSGIDPDGAADILETVKIAGPSALPLIPKTRRVTAGNARVTAQYEGRFRLPGDYTWDFTLTSPGYNTVTDQRAFRVKDDATPPAGNITRSLVFLIDTSGSMSGQKIENAKRAAAGVARARAGQAATEEWALLSFSNHNVYVQQPFTTDPNLIAAAANRLSASGDTPLAWAIAQAVIYLKLNASGDSGQIIILSDGQESCPERSPGGGAKAIGALNRIFQNLRLTDGGSAPRLRLVKHSRGRATLQTLDMTASDEPRLIRAQAVLGQQGQTVDDAIAQLEPVLRKPGKNFSISIVGFGVDTTTANELKSIAESSGGAYLPAERADELESALVQAASSQQRGGVGFIGRTVPGAGVQVLWLELNSEAEKRLLPGDIVTAVDGKRVTDVQQLTGALAGAEAGKTAMLTITRDKKPYVVAVQFTKSLPQSQRTTVVSGVFRGQSFAGTFTGYLDPNRRNGQGIMAATTGGKMEGKYNGVWNPDTGDANFPFTGTLRLLLKFNLKGVIVGSVARNGSGRGTYDSKGLAGTERGEWQCEPYKQPDVAAF